MKKIIATLLCLTLFMSASGLCTYGGLASSGDFYSFYDSGRLGNTAATERAVAYIKEIVENYYDLTGVRVLIQMQLDDAGEVNGVLARMLDKKLPFDEALDKYTADLIKYAKNKYPTTDKWVSVGYYGTTNDVYVAQQGVEILSEDDIIELRAKATDNKKGLANRMDDFLAAIFYKLYNGLEYDENKVTKDLIRIYEQKEESGFYILPFVVISLPVIGIVGYIVTKKKEKKQKE